VPRPSARLGIARLATWVLAIVACVAPFHASFVPPLTDVSQHVLVARVLVAYREPALRFADYFGIGWGAAPGMLFYVLLSALQRLTAPFWDARLYLTLWVGLLALSVGCLAKVRGHRDPSLPALLVLPLAFCWYVYMGFLPFLMTLPLFAVTVACWLGNARPTVKIALVWTLLVGLFGFQVVGMAAAAATIAVDSAIRVFSGDARPSRLAWAAVAVVPVPLLLGAYLLGSHAPTVRVSYAGPLVNAIDTVKFTCSTLGNGATVLMLAWLLTLGALIALQLPALLREQRPFAAAAGVLIGLAILMPGELGALWPAGPRLLPYAIVLLAVCLRMPDRPTRRRLLVGGSLALLVGLSMLTIAKIRELRAGFEDFLAAARLVEPGRRFLPILVDPGEGSRWTAPYWSLGSAYTVLRGGFNPYVFASPYVRTGASPLYYRESTPRSYAFLYDRSRLSEDYRGVSRSYDYVLLWGDDPALARVLGEEMTVLSRRGRATLYGRREG
jgi:hypothetical protein